MSYKVINAISSARVPMFGNAKQYIAIHYLGVVGQNHDINPDGCGAHYYVYWDGTIYQRCGHDAIVWAVGTAGYYTQKHPIARNSNTISIEMCCKCDGNVNDAEDKTWYFTKETQEATVWLVRKLMKELNIPIENVLRHFDIVNKTCPAPYVHNNKYKTSWTWNEFRKKVSSSTMDVGGFQASSLQGLTEAERIKKIAPLYQASMAKTGMLASVGIAQFCLESGYGSTDLALHANNLHGMKANLSGNTWSGSSWDGNSVYTKKTSEQDETGREYYITADFRKYSKCEDSIADRAAYFSNAMNGRNKRYPGLIGERDYKTAIQIVKDGGYATDTKYVDKLVNLVERWNLTQYDDVTVLASNDKWYRVRLCWGDSMDGQIGAYLNLDLAKQKVDKNPQYKVYDENGKVVYEVKQYAVQAGTFKMKSNAEKLFRKLKKAKIDSIVKKVDGVWKVQLGVFSNKENAEELIRKVKAAGFQAILK